MPEPAHSVSDPEIRALKTPPHSIEAEQSVLGGLFLDQEAYIKVIERVQADDFYRQDHRIIYNAIQSLDNEGKPFDLVTVAEWLESHRQLDDAGGLSYLAALA
ncbi:MAG: replicative DNA helicase, partial [Gammaproteobacteria bacterium]|nr:replicative DNA helicase [Gammaproteobacteria bacterium]